MGGSDVWVVGESFARAAVQPQIETAAGLVRSLRVAPPSAQAPVTLRPGLGVDDVEWSALCQRLVKEYGDAVLPVGEPPRPVSRHRVLKHARDNVLVGDARLDADGSFAAWLSVANETEMLRDHTADQQHVPGALLIEAVLQLVTWAVGEKIPPTGPSRDDPYAVMHHTAYDFRRFVFPLPAQLTGRLEQSGPAEPGKVPLRAEVSVWQARRECSTATVALHAFDPQLIFGAEDSQARTMLDRVTRGGTP